MSELLQVTERGLFCEAGGFYVDPRMPVERAVVTHGHADHARSGSDTYLTSRAGRALVGERIGRGASIETLDWGEERMIGDVRVSLHPAGHVLGSAQVRIERGGEVWVVSGDYKIDPDPTCASFEPVRCDVFLTESTFGLPVFRWRPQGEVVEEINAWWRANREAGRTSVIFAYALGKAQRVLAGVDDSIGPILAHGAVQRFVELYAEAGVEMPYVERANAENAKETKGRALVVAPPSALGSPWMRKFGPVATAFASGWTRIRGTRRRRNVERGFVLSDHADWPGLLGTIRETGASRVGAMHGYTEALSARLREMGLDAWSVGLPRTGGEDDEATPGGESATDASKDELPFEGGGS